MKRKKGRVLAAAALFLVVSSTLHGDERDSKKVSALMHRKLACSQKILEGITTNDLDLVGKNADELIQISKDVSWLVIKTPRFEMHNNEFRRAAESVIKKAKDKNIDGVTLAYFEVTMSCVRCHDYVREVRDVGLPDGRVVAER